MQNYRFKRDEGQETGQAIYFYSALGLPASDPRSSFDPPSRPSSTPPLDVPEKPPRADHAAAALPASSGSTVAAAAACCAQCAQPGAAALNASASATTKPVSVARSPGRTARDDAAADTAGVEGGSSG